MKKELLVKYYLNKGYSIREISKLLKISRSRISKYCRENNIFIIRKAKRQQLNNKRLLKCLIRKGYSNGEISNIINTNKRNIDNMRGRYGLLYSEGLKIKYNKYEMYSTSAIKSLIVGTSLGDSHINKHGRLSCTHSMQQYNYCKWKSDQLGGSNFKSHINIFDKRTKKYYHQCNFSVKRSKFTKELRKTLYRPDKQITLKSLEYFDVRSLAIMFMDDGYKHKSGTICIATNSFTKESLEIFNEVCWKKFQLRFSVQKNSNKIYLPVRFYKHFKKLVKPYVKFGLQYKLP